MNVERDIAGFALPFAAGVLVTAYAGAIFCGYSSYVHFIALLGIFCSAMVLLQRRIHDFHPSFIYSLIAVAALGCGAFSAATAISMSDMPLSGLEIHCRRFGLAMQRLIDTIPFDSDNTNSLTKALLTGERADLSDEIKNAFRESGASHILALSGLHLGIIYGILSKSLAILGNSKKMRILRSAMIICMCGIYTLSTGAGDSLVRALIFIMLREIAESTCRYHGLGQILLVSLIIQLVLDPLAIRSVSFQLSYAAMAGIAFIYPWLQGFWERAAVFRVDTTAQSRQIARFKWLLRPVTGMVDKVMKWCWNTVALSIACQITTAPLAYMYFGTFPLYFMLTNLLTLPLTGLLIPTALTTICLHALGYCPAFLIHATEWMASTLVRILEVISTM